MTPSSTGELYCDAGTEAHGWEAIRGADVRAPADLVCAIAMARTVKASGSNVDVLALADQVITAQQGEITEMNTMLAGG